MVDYSKWKDIEISDDEDETHPNIDTPSLFRWRHQARLERMEERKKEVEDFEKAKKEFFEKKQALQDKVKQAESESSSEIDSLKNKLKELSVEEAKLRKKQEELEKKEKLTPWNVDTISKSGFTKTVINKRAARTETELSEEEREEQMRLFVKENEKLLKQFGMLRKYDDSKRFLQEHPQLVSENTANYLVIWCINLEMEEKRDLMEHVAHQCICMQYMLELSKQLEVDPRACVGTFFAKIQQAEAVYLAAFEDEQAQFKERIRRRAKEKLDQLLAEQEEEERQARLGPGGLDPLEVLESLPPGLKACFEAQDIPLLQATIADMPPDEAAYHMKRCVDSGLWIPDANATKDTDKHKDSQPEDDKDTQDTQDTQPSSPQEDT